MRYQCLILDHDDTAVDSTPSIHYPCHVDAFQRLRPGQQPVSLEDWYRKNFDPGITAFLQNELGLSKEEMDYEYDHWKAYCSSRQASFFPGFTNFLEEFRNKGGVVTVVSHSDAELIARDYRDMAGFQPDLIFGWDKDPEKRKPHPYPVKEILRQTGISPKKTLIVDDLKPAVLMGRAAGVDVAGAGWGHNIEIIEDYMKRNCVKYLKSVQELSEFVLSNPLI